MCLTIDPHYTISFLSGCPGKPSIPAYKVVRIDDGRIVPPYRSAFTDVGHFNLSYNICVGKNYAYHADDNGLRRMNIKDVMHSIDAVESYVHGPKNSFQSWRQLEVNSGLHLFLDYDHALDDLRDWESSLEDEVTRASNSSRDYNILPVFFRHTDVLGVSVPRLPTLRHQREVAVIEYYVDDVSFINCKNGNLPPRAEEWQRGLSALQQIPYPDRSPQTKGGDDAC